MAHSMSAGPPAALVTCSGRILTAYGSCRCWKFLKYNEILWSSNPECGSHFSRRQKDGRGTMRASETAILPAVRRPGNRSSQPFELLETRRS
ncbi:hypothetical protein EVAR_6169_1 [Eumeta japonica]|uniref:Uncharacterized protein n=1 Tax=Eumeta variegata TaxID=151549 RepID=A0A4C1TED1_EUMVA|nr:hypothetical protein EVAR_6169_1 [Eumeta japonica]